MAQRPLLVSGLLRRKRRRRRERNNKKATLTPTSEAVVTELIMFSKNFEFYLIFVWGPEFRSFLTLKAAFLPSGEQQENQAN